MRIAFVWDWFKLLRCYYTLCVKPVIAKQQKLIERRQGLKRHLELSIRFAEIGNDLYVKRTYERLVKR